MRQEKSNFLEEIRHRHPRKHYDYDGITGVWLWLPYYAHLGLALLLLPLILWVFPSLPFRAAHIRYFFIDYRYHLALAITLFCAFSALLSLVKSKQVHGQVRPLKQKEPQVKASPPPTKPPRRQVSPKVTDSSQAPLKKSPASNHKTPPQKSSPSKTLKVKANNRGKPNAIDVAPKESGSTKKGANNKRARPKKTAAAPDKAKTPKEQLKLDL